MVRKTTKTFAGISGICFVISVVVFVAFFITVSGQKVNHISHAQERADAKAHKESLQTLMQVLDETKTERESLFTRFVSEEEVIDFLALIESLGKEQNLELATKSLNVSPINEHFESLDIGLEIEGTYSQVMTMLSMLEELPYQVTILNVQLQQNDDKTWSGMFGINVTKFVKHEN
jgi:Tfp pilus assembly protein PilO